VSRLANDLGLTPTSRARLGLDLASTRRTLSLIELYAEQGEQ
jgi:phage terminase small subunit